MGRTAVSLVLLACVGCVRTYSPPIRGLLAGMPDRVARGQLEVGGTVGGFSLPTTGGPHVGYGYSDTLVIEGGANLNFVDGYWATGWGGVRLLRSKALGNEVRLVGDLELGAGLGAGGVERNDSSRWTKRFTWGMYEGLGVGLRWRWLGAFLRGRLDSSETTSGAATLWPTVMLGLEARAGPLVFSVGGGRWAYWNQTDGLVGWWFYQGQVSLLFDLVPQRQ
jgi:hypothetical protein